MKLYTFDNGDGVKRVGVELSGFPGLIRDVRDFGLDRKSTRLNSSHT